MKKIKKSLTIGLAVLLMLCMSISLVGCKKENAYQDIKYNGFTYTWHKKSNTYYLTGDLVQNNPEIMNIPPYINGNEVSYFGFLEFSEGGMNFADQFNKFYSPSLRNVIELSIPYCMNIEEEYGLETGHSTYENNCPEKIIVVNNTAKKKDSDAIVYSFLHIKNADTYVTGSNAKFLSKDIITEFRGRGDEIHISPLSFKEFYSVYDGSKEEAWKQYCLYGGLPKVLEYKTDEDKVAYLKNIFEETYLTDIKERHVIRNDAELNELLDILSSSIGSLTNPKKLSDTFKSVKQVSIHADTLNRYLEHLVDSYLIAQSKRYDIKGKKYINTPSKYYFTDMGLRNARLNFRQYEETHIMENVIYNELQIMGFNVDVGVVEYRKEVDGKSVRVQAEVDFVCNKADKRYYIQSAFSIPTREKMLQEQNSLTRINDSFKKIIIVKDAIKTHYNDDGVLILNLFDFLLEENSLEN